MIANSSVELIEAGLKFGNLWALHPCSLRIKRGERVAVIGLSGSGKTTLLNLVGQLAEPSCGSVENGGEHHLTNETAPDLGVVFQSTVLFPHLTVLQNVAFPMLLRCRRKSRHVAESRATELLGSLGISRELLRRLPKQLSGGQAQRVGLARAVVHRPNLLLLDEPFSAIDRPRRSELVRWLLDYHDEFSPTVLFVTHNPMEAFEIGTRVLVLEDGHVVQDGSPDEIYHRPRDLGVGLLTGALSVVPRSALHGDSMTWGGLVAARPENIMFADTNQSNRDVSFVAEVARVVNTGREFRVEVQHKGDRLEVLLSAAEASARQLVVGQEIKLAIRAGDLIRLPT